MNTMLVSLAGVLAAVDPTPSANDTKAGWGAFALFLGLAVAVGLLGWSLTRHLRKTKQNAEAGVFGDAPAQEPSEEADSTPQG